MSDATVTKICRQCKKPFKTDRPKALLCQICKKKNHADNHKSKFKNGIGEGPGLKRRRAPAPAPNPAMLKQAQKADKLQAELNMRLDAKLYADCGASPVRVIRPGDPEFDVIARQVTPLECIHDHAVMPFMPLCRQYIENGGFPV